VKLISVDAALLVQTKHVVYYAILKDASVHEIRMFAIAHPRVFVFPFATKAVEDCHDYTELGNGETVFDHVVAPLYIGNFKPEDHGRLILECVDRGLGGIHELVEVEP
jgi:hypothetical protein